MTGGLETATGTPRGSSAAQRRTHRRDKGLLLIGVFKLLEASFFVAVGMGALHFVGRDLGDAALKLATRLHQDPEGGLVTFVLNHVDAITAERLRQIGVVTFLYAVVRVTEGVGLVLERAWAEWLTIAVTASFLPWELYEIVKKLEWIRVGLFVINLAALAYLVFALKRKMQHRETEVEA